jgi:hypothetical protein
MSDICVPSTTDWSCRWTAEELAEQRADPVMGPKIDRAEAFAWSLLASLTAYRIGTCPITVRPCAAQCLGEGSSYVTAIARGSGTAALPAAIIGQFNPYITGGRWLNACGCRPSDCSCTALSEVVLPGPVGSIVSVYVDGTQLMRSAYKVMNGNRLVRLDGDEWPACQDMTENDQQGFSVTYYRGAAPNVMTNGAAGVLANEFLLACDQDANCRLPYNVTNVTRAGETFDLSMIDFVNGDTGIPEVQALIRIYNPNQLKSPVIVASPDVMPTRMTTWG